MRKCEFDSPFAVQATENLRTDSNSLSNLEFFLRILSHFRHFPSISWHGTTKGALRGPHPPVTV